MAQKKPNVGSWRHFEYRSFDSEKFWEIRLQKCCVETRYGRINATPRSHEKQFKSREAAKKSYDKIVLEKRAKGYIEANLDFDKKAKKCPAWIANGGIDPYSNYNRIAVLSPAADAVAALTKMTPKLKSHAGVYGMDVPCGPAAGIAYKFVGSEWTILEDLSAFGKYCNWKNAEKLSKKLATDTLFAGISDTAWIAEYDHWNSGSLIERFRWGCYGPKSKEMRECPGQWKEHDDTWSLFISKKRKTPRGLKGDGFGFADRYFKEKKAFVFGLARLDKSKRRTIYDPSYPPNIIEDMHVFWR